MIVCDNVSGTSTSQCVHRDYQSSPANSDEILLSSDNDDAKSGYSANQTGFFNAFKNASKLLFDRNNTA